MASEHEARQSTDTNWPQKSQKAIETEKPEESSIPEKDSSPAEEIPKKIKKLAQALGESREVAIT